MISHDIRRAVEAAPLLALPALSAALWKSFAAGSVPEDEADAISKLIEARKAVPTQVPRAIPRGPRPKTPDSMARRRRWAASGWLPPNLASRFTPAETAALAVVAWECARKGRCTLPIGKIAALAGIGRTKVKDAIRIAKALGAVSMTERRVKSWRSETNVVAIECGDWKTWLTLVRCKPRRDGSGDGVGPATTTNTQDIQPGKVSPSTGRKGLPGRGGAPTHAPRPMAYSDASRWGTEGRSGMQPRPGHPG